MTPQEISDYYDAGHVIAIGGRFYVAVDQVAAVIPLAPPVVEESADVVQGQPAVANDEGKPTRRRAG